MTDETPRTAYQAAGHHRRRAEAALEHATVPGPGLLRAGIAIAEALLAIEARLELLANR